MYHKAYNKVLRDFLDVCDVINAYCELMKSSKSGETYNVGSVNACKIYDLLKKLLAFLIKK